jgi:glycosyltransferase involved in cell wall biosynthesis
MDDRPHKLPITALVVVLDAERWLPACLPSIRFCDEILVVDIGSKDRSVEIALGHGARVITHARVPFAEVLWPDVVPQAKHDWIMRFDPDEVFDDRICVELQTALSGGWNGIIRVPYQYYFRRQVLSTTIWGGVRHMNVLFHRSRVEVRPFVHGGLKLTPGYVSIEIDKTKLYPVQHYWIDDWTQMREKHARYLLSEGPDRLARGEHFGWFKAIIMTGRALGTSLVWRSGWRGGADGWALSFFYAGYVWRSQWSLRKAERAARCCQRL